MSPYRDTVNGNSATLADFAMDMEKTSDCCQSDAGAWEVGGDFTTPVADRLAAATVATTGTSMRIQIQLRSVAGWVAAIG